MNLERVEERCLAYLAQSPNPLVPLQLLLEHCQRGEDLGAVTERDLLEFLGKHGDVFLLQGPEDNAPVSVTQFAEAGLLMGPRAILRRRVPPREELLKMMDAQVEEMIHALQAALEAAPPERRKHLEEVLGRAGGMRAMLKNPR